MAHSESSASSNASVPQRDARPRLPARPLLPPARKSVAGERKKPHQSGYLPLMMFIPLEVGKVYNSNCFNASNPYHICGEYCRKRALEAKDLAVVAPKSSLEGKVKENKVEEKKDVNPVCKYASNPYHKCISYCLEEGQAQNSPASLRFPSQPKERNDGKKVAGAVNVGIRCRNANNPGHKCSAYCFEKAAVDKKRTSAVGRKDAEKIVQKGNLRMNSSPVKVRNKEDASATESVVVGKMIPARIVHPECRNASNPYHLCGDYCLKKPENNLPKKGGVSQQCSYASNPFHKCANYCFKNVPGNGTMMIDKPELRKDVMKKNEVEKVRPQPINQVESSHKPVQDRAEKVLTPQVGLKDAQEEIYQPEISARDVIVEENTSSLEIMGGGLHYYCEPCFLEEEESEGSSPPCDMVADLNREENQEKGGEESQELSHASISQEVFQECSSEIKPRDKYSAAEINANVPLKYSHWSGSVQHLLKASERGGSKDGALLYSLPYSPLLLVVFSIFFMLHLAHAVVNEAILTAKKKDGINVHLKCASASDADHQ